MRKKRTGGRQREREGEEGEREGEGWEAMQDDVFPCWPLLHYKTKETQQGAWQVWYNHSGHFQTSYMSNCVLEVSMGLEKGGEDPSYIKFSIVAQTENDFKYHLNPH